MDTGSDTKYTRMSLELLEGAPIQLRADRDRGAAPVNNFYNVGLVTVASNASPKELIPWYLGDNNEPEYLIRLIIESPIALGLLLTKVSILHGQGLKLYQRDPLGSPRPLPIDQWPEEIRDFYHYNDLNQWAYQAFLDHEMVGNFFSQMIFSRGSDAIAEMRMVKRIKRIAPECVRAINPKKEDSDTIREYVIGNKWDRFDIKGYKKIPAYLSKNFHDAGTLQFLPGESKTNSVLYHGKRDMPGFPHYAIPSWYGARKSIELQNEIPYWHVSNIINQFGIRLTVSVSSQYFDRMRSAINPDTSTYYTDEEIKTKLRDLLSDYCTNPNNVGKVLLQQHEYDHQGTPLKDLIIESIQLDLKDEAYTKLSQQMNSAVTSAFGVDSALAAVITDRGMSSGSEKTQAWNIEDAKSTYVRDLVLEPLRFIHRFNQWPENLFWGFENPSLVTKDISPSGMVPASEIQ